MYTFSSSKRAGQAAEAYLRQGGGAPHAEEAGKAGAEGSSMRRKTTSGASADAGVPSSTPRATFPSSTPRATPQRPQRRGAGHAASGAVPAWRAPAAASAAAGPARPRRSLWAGGGQAPHVLPPHGHAGAAHVKPHRHAAAADQVRSAGGQHAAAAAHIQELRGERRWGAGVMERRIPRRADVRAWRRGDGVWQVPGSEPGRPALPAAQRKGQHRTQPRHGRSGAKGDEGHQGGRGARSARRAGGAHPASEA